MSAFIVGTIIVVTCIIAFGIWLATTAPIEIEDEE